MPNWNPGPPLEKSCWKDSKRDFMHKVTENNRSTLIWYGVTIFISSAILLVLEITAGRLIAPYVGITIYSWTSIIGVILAGLSLGNWIGGVMADRGSSEKTTGIVLALAAVFSVLSLLSLTLVAPLLQGSELDLISSSFLYVLSMFFIPSVLLGIPTPLLTTLALNLDKRTGHIVGRMHALAALGSITGTFITGFFLIQYLGSRNIIVLSALILLMLAMPFFRRSSALAIVMLMLTSLAAGMTYVRQGFNNPCEFESDYFCVRVVDASQDVAYGEASALVLDHLLHGINHKQEPTMLVSPYVHVMQELVGRHFSKDSLAALSYFFAGGGSYTQPRAVKAEHPTARVTVAELDPMVTGIVREKMFVDTAGMNILHGDARSTLQKLDGEKFDVVVTDAFHDIAIPYHLVTQEYVQLVKSRMNPGGLFTTNVVDVHPDPRMVKSMIKTLQTSFKHVDVWLHQLPDKPERMTYVISASDRQTLESEYFMAQAGLRRSWYKITVPLLAGRTGLDELPVFTDDYVPVERMISDLLLTSKGL